MTDPLLSWRREFPAIDKTVYLISHSLGAMPRRTRDQLNEYADVQNDGDANTANNNSSRALNLTAGPVDLSVTVR